MSPPTTAGWDHDSWLAAHEEARRALPGVDYALADYREHLRLVSGGEPLPTAHAVDLYLAGACAKGDPTALKLLEHGYLLPVRGVVGRYNGAPHFVDEVMQELREKLLLPPEPRIARYGGKGPLGAWIRVAAGRVAIDFLRAADPATAGAGGARPEALADADLGPEVQILREVYREAFQDALKTALGALSPKDRNLLRRHLVDHMTLEEIAGPYGVHPATVARRLQALREEIAETVRAKLAATHLEQGGVSSLASLAQAIRSEVYVSLSPLLASVVADRPGDGADGIDTEEIRPKPPSTGDKR
jgi:RNA polymerase sigma-70 factor (ECF subfamily)